jgi:hypothetical protein
MRQIKYILMTVAVAMMAACEVIPEGERVDVIFTPSGQSEMKRTSLLIEYSGWQCVNCPTAAEEAHRLKEQFGENLVVVVMHPESNPNTRHNNKPELNFTCPEADEVYKWMGGTNTTPFPTGNVNMIKNGEAYFSSMDQWATLVNSAYNKVLPIAIDPEVELNAASKEVAIDVEISNLGENAQEVKLMLWLTEDGVIGKQKKPEGTDNAYEHNHLLRASISPVWGHDIAVDAMGKAKHECTYTLPEKVVAENCNVVALVSVNGEVVQATECRVNGGE